MIRRTLVAMLVLVALAGLSSIAFGQEINATSNLSENVSAIAIVQEINATSNLSENVSAISPSASDEIIELKLFGTSKTSWEDAVETAINSAEISGFRYAKVEEQNVRLEDGKITEYTATVKLSDSEEPA